MNINNDLLSIYHVAKILKIAKKEVYYFIDNTGMIFVRDIIGTKRWYIYRRDLINFLSYVLDYRPNMSYNRYYGDILPEYNNILYPYDIKNILDLEYLSDAYDIMRNNADLNCKISSRGGIYVTKLDFMKFMWLHRRFIPGPEIKKKIVFYPSIEIYSDPEYIFDPRMDSFIPESKSIVNPFIYVNNTYQRSYFDK